MVVISTLCGVVQNAVPSLTKYCAYTGLVPIFPKAGPQHLVHLSYRREDFAA